MSAAELISQLREQGVRLWLEQDTLKFRAPPGVLDEGVRSELRLRKQDLINHLRADVGSQMPELLPGPETDSAPLSYAQQSLWFLQQLYPDSTAANEQFLIRIAGSVDVDMLENAWHQLLQRHSILRTRFAIENEAPRQIVDKAGVTLPQPADLRTQTLTEAQQILFQSGEQEILTGFDLLAGPLLRPLVYLMPRNETVILVTAHHIVADGLSVALICAELAELYANPAQRSPQSPDQPRLQFSDYAHWEQQALNPDWMHAEQDWWRKRLSGLSGAPLLSGRQSHAERPRSLRLPFTISSGLSQQIRLIAQAERATGFMVLLAAWRIWLAQCFSARDFLIGSPVTLRKDKATANMPGCLVNNVALRNPVDPNNTFRDALRTERAAILEMFEHSQLPFERVVEAVRPERILGRHPLFQVMFFYMEQHPPQQTIPAFSSDVLAVARDSFWDMDLTVSDSGAGAALQAVISVRSDLVDAAASQEWPESFAAALEYMLAAPDSALHEIPLLSHRQRRQFVDDRNATAASLPAGATLDGLVSEQARRTPTAIAVVDGHEQLDYAQLEATAEAYRQGLQSRGVQAGDVVGISVQRSADSVALILGVLKCGAAWLSLDPDYPAERLRAMLDVAQPRVLIVSSGAEWATGVDQIKVSDLRLKPFTKSVVIAAAPASSEARAYILFTSGTTGKPKGVAASHATAVNRCLWMWDEYGFSDADNFAQRTSYNFIDSVWEIFGPLMHGARVTIMPADLRQDPAGIAAWLSSQQISHLVTVPTLLDSLLHERTDEFVSLHTVITSGEPLSPDLLARFQKQLPDCRLLNTYGATEFWDATCARVDQLPAEQLQFVPIGKPIANMRCHILNAEGQPLPPGMDGELYIAGIGVPDGYLNAPTAQARFQNGLPGQSGESGTVYRSGDRARYRVDGNIELLGRLDRQFKINGIRVEAAEVEHHALAYSDVSQCAFIMSDISDMGARQHPVLFVASLSTGGVDVDGLREFLRQRLPHALVPADIRCVSELPLTPSGKVDVLMLGQQAAADEFHVEFSPPGNPIEQAVADIWSDVLGIEQIGIHDDFFALGGHSLQATGVIARLGREFGVDLPLQSLFERRTVAQLADSLAALKWTLDNADGHYGSDSGAREVIRL